MARKKVVSIRLAEDQVEDLRRTARRLGRTPSQVAAMLVDEGLRRERFPQIEMRDSAAGRQGYLRGHRIGVSSVVAMIERGETPEQFAEARHIPLPLVRAALEYAEVFPEEIEAAKEWERTFWENPEKFLPAGQVYRPSAPTP